VTLTPTFPTGEKGCTAKLFGEKESEPGRTAHIDMNGCDYLFTIGETFGEHNTTHFKCPAGKDIQVTVTGPLGTCTITIKAQTPEAGTAYHKGTNENELTIKPTPIEIHAEYIGGPFKCGVAEGTTSEKVQLDNRIALKATTTAGAEKSITATGSKD
jgi:hypothetical protein